MKCRHAGRSQRQKAGRQQEPARAEKKDVNQNTNWVPKFSDFKRPQKYLLVLKSQKRASLHPINRYNRELCCRNTVTQSHSTEKR